MRKELPHFRLGLSYGGNQDWFREPMMRLGGCAAQTVCEMSIYLDLYKGTRLYPFDVNNLSKSDYIKFASIVKPYLRPRMRGIDRLDIYIDGFSQFLKDRSCCLTVSGFEGTEDVEAAQNIVKSQLDSGIPVPYLLLHHSDREYKDYEWHWFLLNGYEEYEDAFFVKAVTYGEFQWLDFQRLWNTSVSPKGGFIVIKL